MEKQRRGLGRGLSALMADVPLPGDEGPQSETRRPDLTVPIEDVAPNPEQPRRHFTEEALAELAASIRQKGILQPIIVREVSDGPAKYQIVAGERRWRAAQLAQLHKVPVLVRDLDDGEVLEIAIIENIQRADLNPVEEATGYRQLMDRFGHTQEKLADSLGKSRSHIANILRLLSLPDDVQRLLTEGALSAGHARALIPTDAPSDLAQKVVARGLSVRETEKLAKSFAPAAAANRNRAAQPEKDADTRALEQDLSANLKMSVSVDHKAEAQSGKVVISYKSLEELDEICRILSLSPVGASI